MNDRENRIRAYTFRKPDRIPMRFSISKAAWEFYGHKNIEKLIIRHKNLFPGYVKGSIDSTGLVFSPYQTKGVDYTDSWGCTWRTERNGITGAVIRHALETWDDFDCFIPPDPVKKNGWVDIDWEVIASDLSRDKEEGRLMAGGLRHGFLFLTMSYMRGYENLLIDMHDKEPKLLKLIGMMEEFNAEVVSRYLRLGVDMMGFPEDLGSQHRLMLSPGMFKTYLKPVYKRLMYPVRAAGKLVHMHSDGYIMDIVDDLFECGVNVINPQDLVNGIDDIRDAIKGKMAIDLDVDRQEVTVRGTPGDIDDLIREEVMKLGSPMGGLSLIYGFYPGTPLGNAGAVMAAMDKYSSFYS